MYSANMYIELIHKYICICGLMAVETKHKVTTTTARGEWKGLRTLGNANTQIDKQTDRPERRNQLAV